MKRDAFQLTLAAFALGLHSFDNREYKRPKKCRLKDCQEVTTHNGGYCSAEHCAMDRKLRRKSK